MRERRRETVDIQAEIAYNKDVNVMYHRGLRVRGRYGQTGEILGGGLRLERGIMDNLGEHNGLSSAGTKMMERTGRLSHGAKVKRGQLTAVQQGRYGTGPAPYGYRRGPDESKPLVIDDREAEVVRMIFREYLNTKSTGKVVNYLHSKGVYTRKGNRWSRQAIAIILSNRTYRGRVSYGDVETEGLHEPIIEPALFYKANALKERKRRRRKGEEDVED